MRTKLSTCTNKKRYSSEQDALEAILKAEITLRHYICDRCYKYHLTSRTKGKRIARPTDP